MTYNNLNRESYHDYIGRRLREESTFGDEKTIDKRDNEIFELKQRISRLEEQVGSLLKHHE
jgi:hypothetical protein